MTVGVSAFAMANTSVFVKNYKEFSKIEKKINIKNVLETTNLVDCYHGFKATLIDCAGNSHSVDMGGFPGECGNSEDGSVVLHYMGTFLSEDCIGQTN